MNTRGIGSRCAGRNSTSGGAAERARRGARDRGHRTKAGGRRCHPMSLVAPTARAPKSGKRPRWRIFEPLTMPSCRARKRRSATWEFTAAATCRHPRDACTRSRSRWWRLPTWWSSTGGAKPSRPAIRCATRRCSETVACKPARWRSAARPDREVATCSQAHAGIETRPTCRHAASVWGFRSGTGRAKSRRRWP